MTTTVATTPKEVFLRAYEREHATTMKVLRAYPESELELRPHPTCRSARELAWVFVLERGLTKLVYSNAFGSGQPPAPSQTPPPPESWAELLDQLEKAHKEVGDMVRDASEEELAQTVKFFTGPHELGDFRRIDFLWYMLMDQIHHRGQFSVYLRMTGAKVPSIYGPSRDEQWV